MVQKTTTSTMVIKNISLEGANDKAIEDAASRIHEASRLQLKGVDVRLANVRITLSASDNRSKSEFIDACNCERSMCNSSGCDNFSDDDIQSSILYLEQKARILQKAKIHQERERAYIAMNAHNILNDRKPASRRSKSSSIWAEAKAMIEAFKVEAIQSEEEEGESDSTSDVCPSTSMISPSSQGSGRKNGSRTRKRRKIDLSMVKLVSSAEFEKGLAADNVEVTRNENQGSNKGISSRELALTRTTREQQAREMQQSMDSRKWISETTLKQIFVLTNTAIYEYRRSTIAGGRE